MSTPYERKNYDRVGGDVVWHHSTITHEDRVKQKDQRPVVLWFTGLSSSGKSTIANAVESKLMQLCKHSYLLDGDNIRRIGEVARLFVDSGAIVLTAFISPFIADREQARQLLNIEQFLEVFIDTPLEACEARDPKGLYKKARAGEIKNFTGIDSEYQPPVNPEIHIKTADYSIEECAEQIIQQLDKLGYLKGAQ